VRAVVGVGLALLVLVPLVAFATRGRGGGDATGEADRLATATLRGLLVLAAFVLVVLTVVVVRR
jgi:hypothetical protein